MVSKRKHKVIVALILAWLVLQPAISGNLTNETISQSKSFVIASISIDSPPDLTFENGSLNEVIRWFPDATNPKNFSVTRDGTVHREGPWTGNEITVFLNHLYVDDLLDEPSEVPSDFEFNCTVFNDDEESAWDVVIVHVIADVAAPIIAQPGNITYEEGSFGHEIRWNITETNPDFYNLTRVSNEPTSNNTIMISGDWNGDNITINVDGLNASRWYVYTLFVNDTIGFNSTSSVNVTVVLDLTAPTVSDPGAIEFEFGSIDQEIRWDAYDSNPKNYSITVLIQFNNTQYGNLTKPLHSPMNVSTSNWNFTDPEGGPIVYDLDYLFLGNYTFLIVLFDINDRMVNNTINVTIYEDIRAPIIDSISTFEYEEGFTGYSLNWTAEETNPRSLNLTRDSEVLLNGTWRGENITISIDGLDVGTYVFNLTLRDFFNQTSFAIVTLIVTPDAHLPLVNEVQALQAYATPEANNLTIQAYVWDINRIQSITVEWHTGNDTDIKVADMILETDDLYSAHLGQFRHGVVVYYKVIAVDNSSVGNVFDTGWLEYEVTPMTQPGLPLAITVVVVILGGLSTLILLSIYFRTRTR
ncbi:MAG: hypothetical protein ACXADF_03205 [Candidatus Thorarchaeota archaeon]|jgi:hypothetical protein